MDRWVKGDDSADARLLTSRWHRDPTDFRVDPAGRGNLFSANLRSRYDFPRADGSGQVLCEDLRQGCGLLVNDAPPLPDPPATNGPGAGSSCLGRPAALRLAACAPPARWTCPSASACGCASGCAAGRASRPWCAGAACGAGR